MGAAYMDVQTSLALPPTAEFLCRPEGKAKSLSPLCVLETQIAGHRSDACYFYQQLQTANERNVDEVEYDIDSVALITKAGIQQPGKCSLTHKALTVTVICT